MSHMEEIIRYVVHANKQMDAPCEHQSMQILETPTLWGKTSKPIVEGHDISGHGCRCTHCVKHF